MIKTIFRKKKCQKAKWLSEEALKIAEKRREVKGKGENESVNHSVMSDSATPWTAVHQAPLPMRFPRQEYWSGLPFPPPGDLPYLGMETVSPALQVDSLH